MSRGADRGPDAAGDLTASSILPDQDGEGADETAQAPGPDDEGGAYRVRVEGFEGPFDLLLQLIARRKLDVSEVDLAEITGEFLVHLHPGDDGTPDVDLDTTTHFLVVAATLIELKAARLLPEPEREELEDLLAEARDVLYARLLEYKAFREASRVIEARLEEHAPYVPRDVALEEHFEQMVPDTALPMDVRGLAGLAAAALAPRLDPHVSVEHLHVTAMTVREAARRLLRHIEDPGERATYQRLVEGLSRAERVVHFLALLELYKLGHIDLDQPDLFGELEVRRLEGAEDLGDIEEPAAAPAEGGRMTAAPAGGTA